MPSFGGRFDCQQGGPGVSAVHHLIKSRGILAKPVYAGVMLLAGFAWVAVLDQGADKPVAESSIMAGGGCQFNVVVEILLVPGGRAGYFPVQVERLPYPQPLKGGSPDLRGGPPADAGRGELDGAEGILALLGQTH